LEAHIDFEMLAAPEFPGFERGRPEWVEGANPDLELEHSVRLWPHKAPGEGHFIALLRRSEDAPDLPDSPAPFQVNNLPTEVQRDFVEFAESTLNWHPPQDRLALLGSYLYLIPDGLPDLRGLSVIHWGWWLGTAKKNRFEPSHALAMGLRPEDVRQTLSMNANDPQLMRYLRGEVLPSLGSDGWVLVTVDGFPLGWGKRVQGRLKSHLPTWLRRM
jgi:NOL1/NOP2/fmu family ribosome biogenesis protein